MTRVFACLQLITSAASVLSRGPQARVPKCRVRSCMIFSLLLPFLFFTICHKYHFTGTVISLLEAPWLFLSTHGTPHSLQVLSKQEMAGQGHTLSSDSLSWPPTKTLRHQLMASSFKSTLTQNLISTEFTQAQAKSLVTVCFGHYVYTKRRDSFCPLLTARKS